MSEENVPTQPTHILTPGQYLYKGTQVTLSSTPDDFESATAILGIDPLFDTSLWSPTTPMRHRVRVMLFVGVHKELGWTSLEDVPEMKDMKEFAIALRATLPMQAEITSFYEELANGAMGGGASSDTPSENPTT